MLNVIWLSMIIASVLAGIINHRVDQVVLAVTDSAKEAFQLIIALGGVMTFWLGIMSIASKAGLIDRLSALLKPLLRPLFPGVPPEHPAMGAMILNIAANMLGLVHAATPFGLKAMEELQRLNKKVDEASDAMCTFLAINTSSVQLLPTTAIAFLAANGSKDPSSVVFSALLATSFSTLVAILAVKRFSRMRFYQLEGAVIHE